MAGLAQDETPPAPAPPPAGDQDARRDSLLDEVRRYRDLIASLRDSMGGEGRPFTSDRQGREAFDRALEEFSGVISNIGRELSNLDLHIEDQTISLRDRDGGSVEIAIPEDLGEQIGRGLSSITSVILNELPDTVRWDFEPQVRAFMDADSRRTKRKVIGGDAVKIWDDVVVGANEEIRGSVVTIFGDAVIEGRIDGNVVVVMGDLHLTETAEVTENVYTIMGRLDRDEDAEVTGSVVVLDPFLSRDAGGMRDLLAGGWVSLLAKQVVFLIVLFLILVLLAVLPRERVDAVHAALQAGPGACLAYGVLLAVFGNLALVFLFLVLSLTIIGIPLALLLLLAMILLGLLAVAVVAVKVGRKTCEILKLGCEQEWLLATIGLLVLHAFTFLGSLLGLWSLLSPVALLLGAIGLGIKILVYFFGMGAIAVSRLGSRAPAGAERQTVV